MVLDSVQQQSEDPAANPGSKRPRSEPSSSDAVANAAGKGGAKIITDWAAPKLAEVATELYKRAGQLRRSIQSNTEAIAKLQDVSAQDKTPSSLTLKLPPAAQKLLASAPGVAELIKQAEKGLLAEALQQRQAQEKHDRAALTDITSGKQFELGAKATIHFDRLPPAAQALIEPLVKSRAEDFILSIHLRELDLSDKEKKEKEAKAERAANKERRAMELDQAPTREVIGQVVQEMVAREMAKEMAKLRKQANLQSRKKVQFESKQHSRSNSRSNSRGRSQSKQSKGRGRSQSRDRGRASSKTKSPRRSKSRNGSKPRRRSATPKPSRRRQSSSRSKSRENSRGGRGSRPRRSPSAKHGGRERSVGASGSRTGARR